MKGIGAVYKVGRGTSGRKGRSKLATDDAPKSKPQLKLLSGTSEMKFREPAWSKGGDCDS